MGLGGSPSPPLSGLSTLAGTTVHVLRECRSTWPRWTDSWDTCEPQCFDRRTNCRSGGHNNLNSHSGPLRAASVPWHLPPLPSFLHPLLLPLWRSELPWHSRTLLIDPGNHTFMVGWSEHLVTILLFGHGCFTHPLTFKIRKSNTKRHLSGPKTCKLSSPLCYSSSTFY